MRKFLVLAVLALMVAGSALAQGLDVTPGVGPTAVGNQDTCDIAVVPAATLLLPYFEVDFDNADRTRALDTAFTVTNVSDVPAIAHVTVWTDWSFPVLDFNIFLTGYDVQGVSLYDLLNRGTLPQTSTSSPRGTRSLTNDATGNPNFLAAANTDCATPPGNIPQPLLGEVQSALTGGSYFGCDQVGDEHDNAIGYITIDTAATCSQSLPTDPDYFATEILFDNQLIGDYLRLAPDDATGNFAGGNPLVHIRAVPPGGDVAAEEGLGTYLPWTFYERFTEGNVTGDRQVDRRQPLPALFAARFIGAPFNTSFAIWREGTANQLETALCDVSENASIPFTEFVRFDERENPNTQAGGCTISPCPPGQGLPETSAPSIDGGVFPPRAVGSTDVGGWVYMNLAIPLSGGIASDAFETQDRPSQNWVTIRMTAEGTYGADFDAAYLANGCSGRVDDTVAGRVGAPKIGPQYGSNGQLYP